jgi:hypothetical protein
MVDAVQGNNRCLQRESCEIRKYKIEGLLIVEAGGTYSYH